MRLLKHTVTHLHYCHMYRLCMSPQHDTAHTSTQAMNAAYIELWTDAWRFALALTWSKWHLTANHSNWQRLHCLQLHSYKQWTMQKLCPQSFCNIHDLTTYLNTRHKFVIALSSTKQTLFLKCMKHQWSCLLEQPVVLVDKTCFSWKSHKQQSRHQRQLH